MATRTAADGTQKELSYRKRLIEIANIINSAGSIQDILVDIKDKMLDLVDAERVTIFALDTKNQELFSLVKAGTEVKEIRVPKTFGSIAGFTALSRKTANIKNAYDPGELTRLHPNLKFDSRWDKASRLPHRARSWPPRSSSRSTCSASCSSSTSAAAAPFSPKDEEAAEELSKILGIAFYNQHRAARSNKPSKYGLLVDKGLVSEKDLENAIGNARVNQIDVSKVLIEDYKVPKEEIGRALAQFFNTPFCGPRRPHDARRPQGAAHRRLPEEEHVRAPREEGRHAHRRRRGSLRPHPPRRHQGHEPGPAPRLRGRAARRTSSTTSTQNYRGDRGPRREEEDLGRIITELGSRRRGRGRGATTKRAEPEIDETDSGIVKLCNQIIIDAYNRGASDIHVEPYGKNAPHRRAPAHRRRLREVPRDPARAPQRGRAALQDHVQAGHLREAQAAGRQDPLQGADGHHRAARGHHPDLGRQRGRGHAHPGRLQAAAPREDGLLRPQPRRVQDDPRRSRTASAWWWGRPDPARPRRCTPASASSTPWT